MDFRLFQLVFYTFFGQFDWNQRINFMFAIHTWNLIDFENSLCFYWYLHNECFYQNISKKALNAINANMSFVWTKKKKNNRRCISVAFCFISNFAIYRLTMNIQTKCLVYSIVLCIRIASFRYLLLGFNSSHAPDHFKSLYRTVNKQLPCNKILKHTA